MRSQIKEQSVRSRLIVAIGSTIVIICLIAWVLKTKSKKKSHREIYNDFMQLLEVDGQWNMRLRPGDHEKAFRLFLDTPPCGPADPPTTHAQSPWQAAIYLHLLSNYLADTNFFPDGRQELANALGLDELGSTLSIFRGQGHLGWPFLPSIEHPGLSPEEIKHARLTTKLFENVIVMACRRRNFLDFNQECFTAIAQHYGLRTQYLDFTTDPSVAVYFAIDQARRAGSKTAVVYMAPLNKVLDDVRIILPPPFAERIYLQRGLFLEMKPGRRTHLWNNCRRVVFDVDAAFEVMRSPYNGATPGVPVDLLPPIPIFESAKFSCSRTITNFEHDMYSNPSAEALTDYVYQSLKLQTNFPHEEPSMERWTISMEMYIRELVFDSKKDQVAIDILRNLASTNEELLKTFVKGYAEAGRNGDNRKLAFANLIAQSLVDIWVESGRMNVPDDIKAVLDQRFRP